MTGSPFEEFYRSALEGLGLALSADDALEGELRDVPAALRGWYRVAGRSWLNAAHNRILGPHELRDSGAKVVFAEENQEVVVWGFDAGTSSDDPEVWQGQAVDDRYEWYSEDLVLSRFLVEMLRHTIVDQRPSR